MPLVNGKHYPYTAAGKKAAEKARMEGKTPKPMPPSKKKVMKKGK